MSNHERLKGILKGGGKAKVNGTAVPPKVPTEDVKKKGGAAPIVPVLVCLEDVVACKISWLWPSRIPVGRLSLLAGMPGLGKSILTTDIAARISRGLAWPDGSPNPKGSVLLICAEDDRGDTIKPRLVEAGADCRNIKALDCLKTVGDDGEELELAWSLSHVDQLEQSLGQMPDCRLVIIDPIGSYLGARMDAHRDNEVRAALNPVAKLAAKRNVAVLLVAHVRKGGSAHADDMVLGSRAFTALSRSVLHVIPDEENKSRRLLLPGKNNLSAPPDGLAFNIIDGPKLSWEEGTVDQRADDHYSQTGKPGPEAESLAEAVDFLRVALADGARPSKEVEEEAREAHSIPARTLDRARKTAGVRSFKVGKTWHLELESRTPTRTPERQEGNERLELGVLGVLHENATNQGVLLPFKDATDSRTPRTPRTPSSLPSASLTDEEAERIAEIEAVFGPMEIVHTTNPEEES